MIRKTIKYGVFSVAVVLCSPVFAGGNADNGKAIAMEKNCGSCHGDDGNSTVSINPKIAGQYESYLLRALKDYQSGARVNAIMPGMVADLSLQDLKDLAAYFSDQESTLKVVDR